MRSPPTLRRRRRVGRVTVYQRSKRFWMYYRHGGQPVRMPVGPQQEEALRVAAKVNAELAEGAQPSLQLRPITIDAMVHQWLDQHEHIRRSSLTTVRRYRAAVHHPTDFLETRHGALRADRFNAGMAGPFVRYLRGVQVALNGQPKNHWLGLRRLVTQREM